MWYRIQKTSLLILIFLCTTRSYPQPTEEELLKELDYYYRVSIPYPGCQDEKELLFSLPLELFLSPGDFPQIPLRYSLLDESAWAYLQINEASYEGYLSLENIELPPLQGREVTWDSTQSKIKLIPSPLILKSYGTGDKIQLDLFFVPSINSTLVLFKAELIGVRVINREKNRVVFYWTKNKEKSTQEKLYRLSLSTKSVADFTSILDQLVIFSGELRPRIDIFKIEGLNVEKISSILLSSYNLVPEWLKFLPNKTDNILIVDKGKRLHLVNYIKGTIYTYPFLIKKVVRDLISGDLWFITDEDKLLHINYDNFYIDSSFYMSVELKSLCEESFEFVKVEDKIFLCVQSREPLLLIAELSSTKDKVYTKRVVDKYIVPIQIQYLDGMLYVSTKNQGLISYRKEGDKKEIISQECKGRFYIKNGKIICATEDNLLYFKKEKEKWLLIKKLYNPDISNHSFLFVKDEELFVIGNEYIWHYPF